VVDVYGHDGVFWFLNKRHLRSVVVVVVYDTVSFHFVQHRMVGRLMKWKGFGLIPP